MTKKYGNNKESTKFSLTTNGTPLQLLLEHSSTVLTSLHQYFLFILFLLRNLFINNIHDHQHIHRMIEPKVLQHKPTNSKHKHKHKKQVKTKSKGETLLLNMVFSLNHLSLFLKENIVKNSVNPTTDALQHLHLSTFHIVLSTPNKPSCS